MTNITKFQDILGAANGDKASVLGKFLYFSLANILVEKETLAQLCEDLNIPYSGSKRISASYLRGLLPRQCAHRGCLFP